MNEYLEVEKDAGRYEVAQKSERDAKTTEECSARKYRKVAAKRTRSSSSEGNLSRKKARKGSKLKFHRRELLGQGRVLRRLSQVMKILRKRKRWPLRSFRIGVVEARPFQ